MKKLGYLHKTTELPPPCFCPPLLTINAPPRSTSFLYGSAIGNIRCSLLLENCQNPANRGGRRRNDPKISTLLSCRTKNSGRRRSDDPTGWSHKLPCAIVVSGIARKIQLTVRVPGKSRGFATGWLQPDHPSASFSKQVSMYWRLSRARRSTPGL